MTEIAIEEKRRTKGITKSEIVQIQEHDHGELSEMNDSFDETDSS